MYEWNTIVFIVIERKFPLMITSMVHAIPGIISKNIYILHRIATVNNNNGGLYIIVLRIRISTAGPEVWVTIIRSHYICN